MWFRNGGGGVIINLTGEKEKGDGGTTAAERGEKEKGEYPLQILKGCPKGGVVYKNNNYTL